MVVPACNPTSNGGVHSDWCKVESQGHFGLHFPDD
uniref:Uncharacterized protein n=1 Tax=Trichinella nativa TaxID=6335 RepID=A0A0V1KGR9_9BILA